MHEQSNAHPRVDAEECLSRWRARCGWGVSGEIFETIILKSCERRRQRRGFSPSRTMHRYTEKVNGQTCEHTGSPGAVRETGSCVREADLTKWRTVAVGGRTPCKISPGTILEDYAILPGGSSGGSDGSRVQGPLACRPSRGCTPLALYRAILPPTYGRQVLNPRKGMAARRWFALSLSLVPSPGSLVPQNDEFEGTKIKN